MPASSGRRSSGSGVSANGRSDLFNAKEKLKGFLKRVGQKSVSASVALGDDTRIFGRRAWWLSYCTEEALDATTLEDAFKWQGRIVRELTRRIELAGNSPWPTNVKTRVLFELMHERVKHNTAIINIDRAMQREETVDWQWW